MLNLVSKVLGWKRYTTVLVSGTNKVTLTMWATDDEGAGRKLFDAAISLALDQGWTVESTN